MMKQSKNINDNYGHRSFVSLKNRSEVFVQLRSKIKLLPNYINSAKISKFISYCFKLLKKSY